MVGGYPFFAFQKNDQNPISEEPIAKIPVCSIPESISRSRIHVACVSTPVRNGDEFRDWNCQNWVGEALAELVGIGCVTGVEREVAIGKMVEVILEAELEDVSLISGVEVGEDANGVLVCRMGCTKFNIAWVVLLWDGRLGLRYASVIREAFLLQFYTVEQQHTFMHLYFLGKLKLISSQSLIKRKASTPMKHRQNRGNHLQTWECFSTHSWDINTSPKPVHQSRPAD